MTKQLKPYELAERLHNIDYPVANGRVESKRLGELLHRLGRVSTAGRRYEEDEHGYVSVIARERGLGRDDASFIVGAVVAFHDPTGNETELGDISFIDEKRDIATVSVQIGEGQSEPMLPEHEAWDIIVGGITRATNEAWTARFGTSG